MADSIRSVSPEIIVTIAVVKETAVFFSKRGSLLYFEGSSSFQLNVGVRVGCCDAGLRRESP